MKNLTDSLMNRCLELSAKCNRMLTVIKRQNSIINQLEEDLRYLDGSYQGLDYDIDELMKYIGEES